MKFRFVAALAALLIPVFASVGCSSSVDLTDYVSEYRSRIYSGTEGDCSIVAEFCTREIPYSADGNVGNMTTLFTVALAAADNTRTYVIRYTAGGQDYSAELAFDSVRMVHVYSQSMSEPQEEAIVFTVSDADDDAYTVTLTAADMRNDGTLTLDALLGTVYAAEKERFDALMRGGTFAGELYVRLLCDDGENYFYIGLIDRNGATYSMLADGTTGEILATHES